MLQNTKELYGHKLAALDGEIGHVKDFYFDDKNWVIRYLVADTGSWLTGRLVLLSPRAFGNWDQFDQILHLKLLKKQIENSPSIESHKPVSRQYEIEYHQYFGWPIYWNSSAAWGLGGFPLVLPPSKDEMEAEQHPHPVEKHLQSTQSITGFGIQAGVEEIGHVNGFLVDDKNWTIEKLVVETGHWYSGKEILISPSLVERISYEESKIYVTLTKADIQRIKEEEPSKAGSGIQDAEVRPTIAMMQTMSVKHAARTAFFQSFESNLSATA